MSEEQIKKLQATGGEQLASTEKNILDNNLPMLWETVKMLKGQGGGRIDFILDNAGFELYCDFVYGGRLLMRSPSPRLVLILGCSRFLDPGWLCQGDQVPRKEVPLVRLRRDEEGLELALEHDDLRTSVPHGQ